MFYRLHRENYSIEWYIELYVVIMLSVSVTVLVKLLAVTMDWTRPVVSLSQFGIEKNCHAYCITDFSKG